MKTLSTILLITTSLFLLTACGEDDSDGHDMMGIAGESGSGGAAGMAAEPGTGGLGGLPVNLEPAVTQGGRRCWLRW